MLFLGLVNYVYSFAFWSNYSDYLSRETVLENPGCDIPGLTVLASYSMFLVMIIGSIVLGIFVLAFLQKLSFLLSVLICPVTITNCRKSWRKVPLDFEHYADEFNFTVGDDEEPECAFEPPSSPTEGTKLTHKKRSSA